MAKAQEEDSVFRIRSAEDLYQVLTNKEALEKMLQQGLREEHMQYKDRIVELFMNMKDKIKVEDLSLLDISKANIYLISIISILVIVFTSSLY